MKNSEDLLFKKLMQLSFDEMSAIWLNHPMTYTPGNRRKVRALFKESGWIFNKWAKIAVIPNNYFTSNGKQYRPCNIPLNKRHNKL